MKKSVLLPYERYELLIKGNQAVASHDMLNTSVDSPPSIEHKEPIKNKLGLDKVLSYLPKRNISKARALLNSIEHNGRLEWNENGELLVSGKVIPKTHIADLIHDALNCTKHEPVGCLEFYKNLDNVPRSLITNPRRKALIGGGFVPSLPPPGIPTTKPKPLNSWKTLWKPL